MIRAGSLPTGSLRNGPRGTRAAWIAEAIRTVTDDCVLVPWAKSPQDRPGHVRTGPGETVSATHYALTLVGRPKPEGPGNHVLHTCPGGDQPACVNPRHLRWGTEQENTADKLERGRHLTGEEIHTAKLTASQVDEIRRRYVAGSGHGNRGNAKALAAEYGVSHQTIRKVAAGETWREPLVVFRDVAYCDSRFEHEITLISDGQRSYAHGDGTDCGTASRYDATLSVTCGQPGRDDEPCDGRVEFNLDTAGTWTADPMARRLLAEHGEPVER